MTDRYNSITVVLEKDIRDDDAEPIIEAIKMLKGVLAVSGNVAEYVDYVARERANKQWREKLYKLIYPEHVFKNEGE